MTKKRIIQYTKLFNDLKRVLNPTTENIGSVVCFNYHITSSQFKETVKRSKRDFSQTEKDKEKWFAYAEKVEEFERNILENLNTYRILIYSFIEGNYLTLTEFFRKEEVDKNTFNDAINAIILYDEKLYNTYSEELEKRAKKQEEIDIKTGKEILKLMENGVELEDGTTRPFDAIDYYMITKTDPSKMVNVLRKNASNLELLNLKKFKAQQMYDVKLSIDTIDMAFNQKYVFDCKQDKKGNLLLNTGREISEQEKLDILNYLVENDIPITQNIFYAGIRRIKDESFYKKSEVEKKLVLA